MRLKRFHLWRVKSALQRINSGHTRCKYLLRAPGLYWLSKQHYNIAIIKTKCAEICDCHSFFNTITFSSHSAKRSNVKPSIRSSAPFELQLFSITYYFTEEEPDFGRDPQSKLCPQTPKAISPEILHKITLTMSWPLRSMEDFIFYITTCKNTKGSIKFFWLWLERLALAPARPWITLYHPFTPSTTIISLPRIVVIWLPPFIISAFYLAAFPKPESTIVISCITQQKGRGQALERWLPLPSSPPVPLQTVSTLGQRATASVTRISDLPKISNKCQRKERFHVQLITAESSSKVGWRRNRAGESL